MHERFNSHRSGAMADRRPTLRKDERRSGSLPDKGSHIRNEKKTTESSSKRYVIVSINGILTLQES